ncbi:ETC complex I subunit conserved region-domain-containing protein [Dipodascopsis tothii]|uniref:ETC complex I subunit conserved region-domain-containing protein n=1 Tax=Dipodascopsis tothii TaxID=44089 RepID=UPI0034CEA50B
MLSRVCPRTVSAVSRAAPLRAAVRFNSTNVPVREKTEEVSPVELVSGAPAELSTQRQVRIYQRAKTAMQSGLWETKPWRIDWDVEAKSYRWENDMMGWQGSGDYMQATEVKFKTKDDAIRFATNQGWEYYIQEPKERTFRKKEYAINFLHSAGPLKHIRTK